MQENGRRESRRRSTHGTKLKTATTSLYRGIRCGLLPLFTGCKKTETAAPVASAPQPAKPTPAAVVGGGQFSPNVGRAIPQRVYWGVAHVHTGYSFDAGMFGISLTPDDLFRVATGGEVVMDNGVRFKQDKPLDWVAITDHAEYLGISDQIRAGSPELLANPQGKRWYEMSKTSPQEGVKAAIEAVVSMQSGKPVFDATKVTASAWAHATEAAEKWNHPGVFTTLHGFEWTCAPGGNNLHRTVVFRDYIDRVSKVVPFSTFDSQDPAALWRYMDDYATKTGGQVLAIPHNGNLSNGMMYSAETFDGKPMDRAYAETRASHEPLLEATQIKGDSETTPFFHQPMNSLILSAGTSTSTKWRRLRIVCSRIITSALRSSWVWNWTPNSEPIRISQG